MNISLDALRVVRKTGDESLHLTDHSTEFTLLGFWQWAFSNLVSNAWRGVLAEYIVACDLGVSTGTRTEWDAYDLKTPEGIKVEVKSAAYLQTWKQAAHSKVCFDIRPTSVGTPPRTPTAPRGNARRTCTCFASSRTRINVRLIH